MYFHSLSAPVYLYEKYISKVNNCILKKNGNPGNFVIGFRENWLQRLAALNNSEVFPLIFKFKGTLKANTKSP